MHDVISLKPDSQHSRSAGVYAAAMQTATRRCQAVITVSSHARSEIAEKLGYPAEKIYVTPEAPDPALVPVDNPAAIARVRERYGLPERFVLYLGGTERRKNIPVLIDAWDRLRDIGARLVIVGSFPDGDELFPDIPALARKRQLSHLVTFVPQVAQEDLAPVYSACSLFCFPSRYEGFGLPPVEAMACGAPVISSNATSLSEVVGEGGELISPDDADAWTAAVKRALTDEPYRQALAHRGQQWVRRYSWESAAEQTLKVYRGVIS